MGARRETLGLAGGKGTGTFQWGKIAELLPPAHQAGPWLSLQPHLQALWPHLITTWLPQAAGSPFK